MAALNRPSEASYAIHEKVTVDTTDNEDHTFAGIMFPLECKSLLPVDHIIIDSISVRGQLGPLTVWVSKTELETDPESVNWGLIENWDCIYEKTHPPSMYEMQDLVLDKPLVLKSGSLKHLYVHSKIHGDQAIVYDNRKSKYTHNDDYITVHTGRAHVSNKVFGERSIWGWGSPWREHREFVGRINYGVVFKLWNPNVHVSFGPSFKKSALAMLMCQRRLESPVCLLPDECIYYILNLCRWDWADDGVVVNDEHSRWRGDPPPQVEAEESVRSIGFRRRNTMSVYSGLPGMQHYHRYVVMDDEDIDYDDDYDEEYEMDSDEDLDEESD